jgi:hypothetical protein
MTCCRSLGGRRVAPQSDLECERLPEKKGGLQCRCRSEPGHDKDSHDLQVLTSEGVRPSDNRVDVATIR